MAIIAVFQAPGFTKDVYEDTVRKVSDGKSRMESPVDWPVPGLLVHAAGQGESGFRVVAVWESEDAFARFGERLLPVLKEHGIDAPPEVYPAHEIVKG
jgi:hypothetical protein